ncbi:MAG: hypothetical protein SFV54_21830 [Bryobacteraceae bacterium]|nr:hypothetical protein [Bryobacteraceae bacterium]
MMHTALILALMASAATAQEPPRVNRAALAGVERAMNMRWERLIPDNPYGLLGMTRGVYLDSFGAVFSAEVNLVIAPGPSPFRSKITEQELAEIKRKKTERLPILRANMKQALLGAAMSVDTVPLEEQIVVAVSLFHHSWEDSKGLPQQIVMRGQRKQLVQAAATQSVPDNIIQVKEY